MSRCITWYYGEFLVNMHASYMKALMQAIEHEIEVTVRVHEVRSEYERQMEEYVLFSTLNYF